MQKYNNIIKPQKAGWGEPVRENYIYENIKRDYKYLKKFLKKSQNGGWGESIPTYNIIKNNYTQLKKYK